ncbi:MAG: NFACT family protein [Clostridia bacterium]
MAFDGIVTKAITSEISQLKGSRIDKIFEPNKNTIILGIYQNGINYALNICIDAQYCRINLTTHQKANPQVAPNFCMLLRKNLIGLKLKNIITFDLERLIILEFEGFDELDDIISKKLVIELMGKHSNIILLDDSNIIIDSLRHIKEIDENFRDILPHTKYTFPTSNKISFLELKDFEDFKEHLNLSSPNSASNNNNDINNLPTIISNIFNGISKNFINAIIKKLEISDTSDTSLEKIFNYTNEIITNIGTSNISFESIKSNDGTIKDYFLIPEKSSSLQPFDLNFFIDDFYFNKESNEQFKNYRNTLLKLILDTLKKYKKRLYNIDEKLKECDDMDKYKLYGELITSNLYRIPNRNVDEIELENYYENNNKIKIKLDKRFSPSINAKRFFKKYSKLKNALIIVSEQKADTLKELDYIESVIYELENCSTIEEIAFIYEEISENDIFKEKASLKANTKKNKVKKSKLTKNKTVSFNPIKYTVDGYTVFVGRNNKENDYLTLKFASKTDLWFHTKDFHGSHTILKLDNNLPYPNNDILIKVAELAAKHSKARNSSNVPVDYCEVKFVKKPSGSKPGMVIYTNNKTLNVNP